MAWAMIAITTKRQIQSALTGAARDGLTFEEVGELVLPLPTCDEQGAIVSFLNRETAKIDALVDEQKRLIELLKEKRQAVISHAVTKGIDPSVPMKDSGFEWLGKVPEHWVVVPLKVALSFQEGPGIMAADFRDTGVPLLRVSGVQGKWASLEGANYLDPEEVAKRWNHFRLNAGDILISASASLGSVCEVEGAAIGAIPYTGLIRLWPRQSVCTKQFAKAFLSSDSFLRQVDVSKSGATMQHFGPTHLRQMSIALPPLKEQDAIARVLERTLSAIDQLLAEIEFAISLFKERRLVLITAAVTGKIDVRELAGSEVEAA
jgi:type I restriction enzyme S subunit